MVVPILKKLLLPRVTVRFRITAHLQVVVRQTHTTNTPRGISVAVLKLLLKTELVKLAIIHSTVVVESKNLQCRFQQRYITAVIPSVVVPILKKLLLPRVTVRFRITTHPVAMRLTRTTDTPRGISVDALGL